MLAITYILALLVVILGAKNIHRFLYKIYKQPLLTNTYAEFIPSLYIEDEIIFNNNETYSSVVKIEGFKYYESSNLTETIQTNYKIKQRAFNLFTLQETVQIKLLFRRLKTPEGYENNNYIEITATTIEELKSVSQLLQGALNQYNPLVLSNEKLQDFLFFNSNLVKRHIKDTYSKEDEFGVTLRDVCSYSNIVVDEVTGTSFIENMDVKKYFSCLTISFGKEIDLKYFFELITKNIEFDYVFNSKFFSNLEAKKIVGTEAKNVSISESDKKVTVSELKKQEIGLVKQHILNEEETLTIGDCFLILYADNEEELNNSIRIVQTLCSKYELFLTPEKYLSLFFFMQRITGFRLHDTFKFLIPYGDISLYAKKILSSTLAGCFDYIETPKGLSKCDWGKNPICTFNTHYNNFYNFYLHVSEQNAEVGHGVVIAPTGSGKTTFVQYLIKGILSSYKDIDVYCFDRFNGMKIFTHWQEGSNVNFDECQINPLQVDLSMQENKDFLYNFLSILCSKDDGFISAEVENQLSSLIGIIEAVPMEYRNLRNLKETNLLHEDLEKLLTKWIDGSYAHYINAREDNFELNNRFYNFQMNKILEDEVLCVPILYYVMFKIRQKAQREARGHFVFIDEAAAMVRNPYAQRQIGILLQEHRKLRGCVWLAFQNPSTFLNDVNLRQIILGECKNHVIFTSNSLNEEILNQLGVDLSIYTEVETAKRDNKDDYYILLKRPKENVILNINLIKKGENIKLYSSASKDIKRVEQLMEDEANNWVEKYVTTRDEHD